MQTKERCNCHRIDAEPQATPARPSLVSPPLRHSCHGPWRATCPRCGLPRSPALTLPRARTVLPRVGPRHSATPPALDTAGTARTQPHPAPLPIVSPLQDTTGSHSPSLSIFPTCTLAPQHKHKQIFTAVEICTVFISRDAGLYYRDTFGLKAQTTKDTIYAGTPTPGQTPGRGVYLS